MNSVKHLLLHTLRTTLLLAGLQILCGCQASPYNHDGNSSMNKGAEAAEDVLTEEEVLRVDTMGLIVLYPRWNSIDLLCGKMPEKEDSAVILFAEAAYTGQRLEKFEHSNIAGDHVSGGQRYDGYRCERNTGAFVYYDKAWKFCYKNYSAELDSAAKHGGAAFAQEMIIHEGKLTPTAREDENENVFRALCCHQGRLCIIESSTVISFGDFKQALLSYGASEAIYLDMGAGWNYAWYREKGEVVELHQARNRYCTNWITFYK